MAGNLPLAAAYTATPVIPAGRLPGTGLRAQLLWAARGDACARVRVRVRAARERAEADAPVANKMETMVETAIKKQNLTQLMRIKEDDSRIKIYVKASNNKDFVSEVLMFIKGISKQTNKASESMVVSLTGNIDINKMSNLADTFLNEKKK